MQHYGCYIESDSCYDIINLSGLETLMSNIAVCIKCKGALSISRSDSSVGTDCPVLWRGRLRFRQYIKGKRHKYGVKLYTLTEHQGFLCTLERKIL